MTVTYLHHSGFVVELDNCILVFDATVEIPDKFFNLDKPVFIFVSHSHGDHYSQTIWNYKAKNTTYILSSDVFRRPNYDNIITIREGETVKLDPITVRAFGSTDQGVSFLVMDEKETIFFAGDLNWWAWDRRTRPHINPEVEERDYKNVLRELKEYLNGRIINCAFVPTDPRLDLPDGELYAAKYFIEYLHPERLVPMHFWGDFNVIDRLKYSIKTKTKIGTFSHKYQRVDFD